MLLLLGALVAGVLTTLAPCVLPLLPVIVGGSLDESSKRARRRAYVITASLGASVVVFTLALKASTALIGIPTAGSGAAWAGSSSLWESRSSPDGTRTCRRG